MEETKEKLKKEVLKMKERAWLVSNGSKQDILEAYEQAIKELEKLISEIEE